MIDEDSAKQNHYQIGLFLKNIGVTEHQFDVVHHLNKVSEFFTQPEQRLELAQLNLAV
jgi:predicted ATPase